MPRHPRPNRSWHRVKRSDKTTRTLSALALIAKVIIHWPSPFAPRLHLDCRRAKCQQPCLVATADPDCRSGHLRKPCLEEQPDRQSGCFGQDPGERARRFRRRVRGALLMISCVGRGTVKCRGGGFNCGDTIHDHIIAGGAKPHPERGAAKDRRRRL